VEKLKILEAVVRAPLYGVAGFAGGLKVQLCIVHPQNDARTPLKPILKYAMRLLELGKTFELHVLPEAGHAVTRMDDALKLLLPAAVFLEKYLAR
jgi:dipeptidyl aminopeptidase/acylaminoacyl peptidase